MATTGLFVEIVVMGVLAELWFVTALLALVETSSLERLLIAANQFKDFVPIVAVILLAATYAIGWVVNFVAERIFRELFQRSVRDRIFPGRETEYEEARAVVFQHGSPELLQDFTLDRHVVRIARSNVINFTAAPIAVLLHWRRVDHGVVTVASITSFAIALLSFGQWRTRYETYYHRVAVAARLLACEKAPVVTK